MKRILTRQLVPGMVLANDVHTFDSTTTLLEKGTILDEKEIARLAFHSVIDVLVEDDYQELSSENSSPNLGCQKTSFRPLPRRWRPQTQI